MPYEDMILGSPNLAAYWPGDDAATSSTARDATGNGNSLSVTGTGTAPSFGQRDLVKATTGEDTSGIFLTGGKYLATPVNCLGPLASGPSGSKTLELWCAQSANPPGIGTLLGRSTTALVDNAGILGGETQQVGAAARLGDPTVPLKVMQLAEVISVLFSGPVGASLVDGLPHHLVMKLSPLASSSLVMDGQTLYTWTAAAEPSLTLSSWIVGANFGGYVQHLAVYSGIMDKRRTLQHYRVGAGYELRPFGVSERLFAPNGLCPQRGSFDIKSGYAVYYDKLQLDNGLITCDPTYLDTLRRSGFFSEGTAP